MRSSRNRRVEGFSWGRREFVFSGAALLAWPILAAPKSSLAANAVKLADYPFQLSVASGDPTADGFVLWTRLAPKPLEDGGGMPVENIEVKWQVANDEAMTKIVAQGTAVATPGLAHSVHVEVQGLQPDRWYWYQFQAAGEASPKGRARTAPKQDSLAQRLRFAFASCQHYETGYYTAYENMVKEDLDLIIHLGDYIYEGKPGNKEKLLRVHSGTGELDTLDDYRNRHAQYKTDANLQAAHQHCPWIVTWDDHEFDNNCACDISEEAHVEPAKFLERRARAYQAYYEHMPLRKAQFPEGPHMKLFRQSSYGLLADFLVLDTRQYRHDQPCGDSNKPQCEAALDPKATVLGHEQKKWLKETYGKTGAKWNILAQQIMMARVDRKVGAEEAYSMDQWPGYEMERREIIQHIGANPASNPVVLTGDIHANYVNDLQVNSADPKSPVVATEFVGTSISSGGDGPKTPKNISEFYAENPFVKLHDIQRGYVSCEVTPTQWKSHFRIIETVRKPTSPMTTLRSFVVEAGKPGAQEA